MHNLPQLIEDLGFILIVASIMTLFFRRIRQPVILGYLLTGFILGPNVSYTHTIRDFSGIKIWADIGVIFLLFALGLEFSFKKLLRSGSQSSLAAFFEVTMMFLLGYSVGRVFSWNNINSLFLGGILAISSTSIIVHSLEELGLRGKSFTSHVYGMLVIEDIVAILMLVLLSTIAVTQSFSGRDLFFSTTKLIFFLILWFVFGIYLIPKLIEKFKPYLSDELTLVLSSALCFLMVILSTYSGFSAALGAFVMGSLLAETSESQRIERLIRPVKDLFLGVFFVSIGMLIDFKILWSHAWPVLAISLAVVIGKICFVTIGSALSGVGLRNSVRTGFSFAQIGEFSFVISSLGLSLGVLENEIFPVVVMVSVITTFLTPLLMKRSSDFHEWLLKALPHEIIESLNRHTDSMAMRRTNSELCVLLKQIALRIVVNSVIVISILILVKLLVLPWLRLQFQMAGLAHVMASFLVLILALPFLWAVGFKSLHFLESKNWQTKSSLFLATVLRMVIAWALVILILSQFSQMLAVSVLFLIPGFIILIFFSKYAEPIYHHFESQFLSFFKEQKPQEFLNSPESGAVYQLMPWDVSLREITVGVNSEVAGKKLKESSLRPRFGVTVAVLKRGERVFIAPTGEEMLWPGDRLSVIASDEQYEEVKNFVEGTLVEEVFSLDYDLQKMKIGKLSNLANKPIKDSALRQLVSGLIVGVERNGERYLNPGPHFVLQENDAIWIVGQKNLLEGFLKQNSH